MEAAAARTGLEARVARASLLWWGAAVLFSALIDVTKRPPSDWPLDLSSLAAACVAGLAWSLLASRWLARARVRSGRESLIAGAASLFVGGVTCAVAAYIADALLDNTFLRDLSPTLFGIEFTHYVQLCLAWWCIRLVLVSTERLVWIEDGLARLNALATDAQSAALRGGIEPAALRAALAELGGILAARRRDEAQAQVLALAERLRASLDRLRGAGGRAFPDADAAEAERLRPMVATILISRFPLVGHLFWAALFLLNVACASPHAWADLGPAAVVRLVLVEAVFGLTGRLGCAVLGAVLDGTESRLGPRLRVLLLAGLAPAVTFLSALAPAGAWMLLRHKPFIANVVLGNADFYIPAYAAWLCLYFYARQARRESAQRRRFAQALEAAAGARNSALRWQVRPHFLFNALNALYTLVIDDRWAQALEMTEALGAYVERSFAEDGRHFVPVAEQAAALNAYLSIEAIRFGERLRLRADIPEALGRAEAPALILHPLVENAMKYAVAASAEPVDIAIWARREGSDLVLAVEDSGGDDDAPQVPGLGVGLSNVEARLAGHYGERASLRCRRLTPKGFVAEIRLPLGAAWTPSAA